MSFRKALFVLFTLMMTLGATAALAAEGGHGDAYTSLGAGLCIAIAAFGGALGQGKTAAAALEGIARNPGAFPAIRFALILGLVLIESLALYTFAIIFVKVV